jgi:serpin B
MKILNLKHILLAGAAVIVLSCEKNQEPEKATYNPKPVTISQKSAEVLAASNDFSFGFFNTVVTSEAENKNVMVSPLSASLALAMTYNGANGSTQTAFENALKWQGLTTSEINESYKELINTLVKLDPKVAMEIANSIWYRSNFMVKAPFIDVNKNYYNAKVSPLNFNEPASKNTINQWVTDQTHGKITKIIDEIKPEDVMYLINALYFKGAWTNRFSEDNTSLRPFRLANGALVNVPTMYMKTDVEYFQNDVSSGIVLPYGQGNYNMAVILPEGERSISELTQQLNDNTWKQWLSSKLGIKSLNVMLPKFKFEYAKQLKEVLTIMGMGLAFSENDADFSGINDQHQLYLSSVLQKTFIEVNEQGTEAAAVTAVTVGVTSANPEAWFKVDRPFLFVIYEQKTNAILFMGKVANPLLTE